MDDWTPDVASMPGKKLMRYSCTYDSVLERSPLRRQSSGAHCTVLTSKSRRGDGASGEFDTILRRGAAILNQKKACAAYVSPQPDSHSGNGAACTLLLARKNTIDSIVGLLFQLLWPAYYKTPSFRSLTCSPSRGRNLCLSCRAANSPLRSASMPCRDPKDARCRRFLTPREW